MDRRRTMRIRVLPALVLALALPSAAPAEELVVGKMQTWARSVRADRQPGPAHEGKRPHSPLYFWMTYHGGEDALRRLREKGSLPIRHRWSLAIGADVEVQTADGEYTEPPAGTYTEQRDIALRVGSGNKQVIQALAGEIDAADTFTWRTWSKKESVAPGVWRVDVLYDDLNDTPVRCEIAGKLRPCSFALRVK